MTNDLWDKTDTYIMKGQIDAAKKELEAGLASVNTSRFKSLIDSEFTNSKSLIADEINKFVAACEDNFEVKAIYLEMNGFDINPDKWFFDFFAFDVYVEDEEDFDWLSDWKSENWPSNTLTGLEGVQKDYDWFSNQNGHLDPLANEASEYASLLVMVKFAWLINNVIKTGKILKHCPILATAHDVEIIPRFFT